MDCTIEMSAAATKHEFAFFLSIIDSFTTGKQPGQEIIIRDNDLIHRISSVVKMQIGEHCIIFNNITCTSLTLLSVHKKELRFSLIHSRENIPLSPHLILYLPLLKRTHLEEAVYNATESGISEIQLIITKKSAQSLSVHEFSRLQKIIQTACEQAKYFTLPSLLAPKPLSDTIIIHSEGTKLWFDGTGSSLFEKIIDIRAQNPKAIAIIIGPEGDFTEEEKKELRTANFQCYSLTPTILRSVSATNISIGLIRSLLK
jgi:16S rRNA (uracil1498-N3)-methyltransferase